jgi:hypothetical protein
VYLIGFAQGTGAHVRDLVRGGIHAYSLLPQVLIAFVRREGIWLAAGVMVIDVAANWTGNWPSVHEDPARLLRPVGLLPITLFGVFVLVTALPLLRVMPGSMILRFATRPDLDIFTNNESRAHHPARQSTAAQLRRRLADHRRAD